jgi:chromosomal replication initiator protein
MQAIAHYVLRRNGDARSLYVSAEQFTNEFINSLKDKRMDAFQRRYRNCDLLLVDDIQFLANKDRSQEEFFHTFNELYETKRQLVFSSDRPPRDIPAVEDRLRSRLEWGLVADIKPPNLETRAAILRKKAEEAGVSLPDEVVQYIASRVRSNIRELEGALMKVAAMASLTGQRIDLELATDALKELVSSPAHEGGRVTVETITKTVAQYFHVTTQDLKGKKRTSNIAFPRQVAMYLCRQICETSLPLIGTEFGGRDHTTVLYSTNKIDGLLRRDRRVRAVIEEIKNLLT